MNTSIKPAAYEAAKWGLTSLAALLLIACGGESDKVASDDLTSDLTRDVAQQEEQATEQTEDTEGAVETTSLTVNAASYTDWVYVSLTEGAVISVAAPETSTDWHLALRRSAIKINGGDSGSGQVAVALADAQAEFYNEDGSANANLIMNADADIEAQALLTAYDTAALSYVQDSNEPALTDWYQYNFQTHQISADTSVGYLIRHADGATYSKLFIDEASYTSMTVRYSTQAADTVQFADGEQTFSASFTDGETLLCLDFDSAQAVSCNSASWELQYEVNLSTRAINLWTNGGVYGSGNGAVFGAIDATALAAYTSATDSNGHSIASYYSQDSSTGLFAEESWYAYNLAGGHKLWPNFRTYLVDTDSSDDNAAQFTLQISNYYSLGASGSPELRFVPLQSESADSE